MNKLKLLVAALVMLATSSPAQGGDVILVIINNQVSVTRMSQEDLRPIFQTTKTEWEGGRALPLNFASEDGVRKGFDAAVLGLDPDRVARYWIDRKIRGGNPPPKELPNAAMVVKVVSAKKEAIGYVPGDTDTTNTKVVAKIIGGKVLGP
jgi:hypothetical protein